MRTLGFTLLGRGVWTSGLGYLRLTASAVRRHLPGRMRVRILVSTEEMEEQRDALASGFAPDEVVVDPRIAGAGRGRRLIAALASGRDALAEAAFRDAGCDCVFENAIYLGRRFRLPVVAWLPDFQHRALPNLFSRAGWWRRELGFRLQARTRAVLVLSSEAARADCERFYPASRGRTSVVRFAAPVDVGAAYAAAEAARQRLCVPDQFLFLPNQFFAHKNHDLIVDALLLAAERGVLDSVLPIVATGSPVDPRDPGHFPRLRSRLEAADVGGRFRHLGLVDYADVLALAAASQALINPSLFEGWSTPIEEAKALGTPMLLANLPVLREQAPDAAFFDPRDPAAFLELALEISARPKRSPPDVEALRRAHEARSQAHAMALLEAVERASASGA